MADPRIDRLALLPRQLEPGEPLAALDAEQVSARRAALQATLQHRLDLVLRPRSCTHELLTPRQPPPHHAAALIGHPDRLDLPTREQCRERARVKPVGLRPRLHDPGVVRGDHDHAVNVRLEQPRDLPRAAGHLQRHPIRPAADSRPASRSPPACSRTRPAERTTPSSQIATTQKSRCTSRPIARPAQPDNPTIHLPTRITCGETQRDNDTDRYELKAQSRQVAGAAERKARARSPSRKPACPPTFSQKAPVPDQPNLRTAPDRPSKQEFHAARRSSRRAAYRGPAGSGMPSCLQIPLAVGGLISRWRGTVVRRPEPVCSQSSCAAA